MRRNSLLGEVPVSWHKDREATKKGNHQMMLRKAVFLAALLLAAAGMGLYVYPTRPTLVWALLGLCWGCYRLTLRAQALFGKHP